MNDVPYNGLFPTQSATLPFTTTATIFSCFTFTFLGFKIFPLICFPTKYLYFQFSLSISSSHWQKPRSLTNLQCFTDWAALKDDLFETLMPLAPPCRASHILAPNWRPEFSYCSLFHRKFKGCNFHVGTLRTCKLWYFSLHTTHLNFGYIFQF